MFAMAREGVFPGALASVSGPERIPWASIVACGVLMVGVGAFGSVGLAAAIGGFLYVIHFLFPLAAMVKLRRTESTSEERNPRAGFFRTPFANVLLPVAIGLSAVLILASGAVGILYGSLWLLIGAATYSFARKSAQRAAGGAV
jgi:APA family basic amino acid/polyamine antiporter